MMNKQNKQNKQNNLLTGIRDLDREIVNKLNGKDLLQMCLLNKTYNQRVLNDDYFRLRTENGFPETVPYKNNQQITNKSWKNHYLNAVKYIDLLERKFQYIYKKLDKSPELFYLARELVPDNIDHTKYSIEMALINAISHGKLEIVKYLITQGADIHYQNYAPLRCASCTGDFAIVVYLIEHGANINNSEALKGASSNGHLEIVKYLVKHGAKIDSNESEPLRYASQYGHFSVVKHLVENGANIHAVDEYAVRYASGNGHLNVVKYLTQHGADITAHDNHSLIYASSKGYLSVVKYLVANGADIHDQNNLALRSAIRYDHFDIVKYLESLKSLKLNNK